MYSPLAINDLRKYLWKSLTDSQLIDPYDYYVDTMSSNLVPIIPAQQVPEFVNLLRGKTFIIYEYKTFPSPVQWWMTEERATFYIDTPNYDLSNKILNLFQDLFRRYDESAKEINDYLGADSEFIFHNTLVGSVESAAPTKAEGDFQEAIVEIEYVYSRKTEANGRF